MGSERTVWDPKITGMLRKYPVVGPLSVPPCSVREPPLVVRPFSTASIKPIFRIGLPCQTQMMTADVLNYPKRELQLPVVVLLEKGLFEILFAVSVKHLLAGEFASGNN